MTDLSTTETSYLPVRGALVDSLTVLREISKRRGCPIYPADAQTDALSAVIMTTPLPEGLNPRQVREQVVEVVAETVDLDGIVASLLPGLCKREHPLNDDLVGHGDACPTPIWCIAAAILRAYVPASQLPVSAYAAAINTALGGDVAGFDILTEVIPALFNIEHPTRAGALTAQHMMTAVGANATGSQAVSATFALWCAARDGIDLNAAMTGTLAVADDIFETAGETDVAALVDAKQIQLTELASS